MQNDKATWESTVCSHFIPLPLPLKKNPDPYSMEFSEEVPGKSFKCKFDLRMV
jgi:hypothetical protein